MAVVKFSKQTIEPNPLEVDYWVDITSDPYGSVWKYYNGIDWVSLNLNDGSDDGLSSFDYYTKEQVNSLLSGKADVDSVESKVDDAEFANVIQNIEFREIGDNQMEMVLLKYDNATVGVTIPMASETNPGMLSGESFRDFVKQSQLQSLYDELYQIMSDLSLAEKERNDAEQLRNTSENERIAAETNRFNAENTRQYEEANRATNENNRIVNENNRVTAENNRTTAEQLRAQAEGNRASTFNTLKGQMQTTIQEGQTAVAATEKATSDAQKVVDEYDEKVSEQDSKLSELGSEVDDFKEAVTNQVNNYKPIEITGDVTNAADEEDLTSDENNLLKLKNRNNLNGMGYVILRKNKTFAEQLTQANTIYEIRYEFDLNGKEIAIPSGCTLKFEGGKVYNGVIIGASTNIDTNDKIIFSDIRLKGDWSGIGKDIWFAYNYETKAHFDIVASVVCFDNSFFYRHTYYLERWETIQLKESSVVINGNGVNIILPRNKGSIISGSPSSLAIKVLFQKSVSRTVGINKNTGVLFVKDIFILDNADKLGDGWGQPMNTQVVYNIFYGAAKSILFENVTYDGVGCLFGMWNWVSEVDKIVIRGCNITTANFAIEARSLKNTDGDYTNLGTCREIIMADNKFTWLECSSYVGVLSLVGDNNNQECNVSLFHFHNNVIRSEKLGSLEPTGCINIIIEDNVFYSQGTNSAVLNSKSVIIRHNKFVMDTNAYPIKFGGRSIEIDANEFIIQNGRIEAASPSDIKEFKFTNNTVISIRESAPTSYLNIINFSNIITPNVYVYGNKFKKNYRNSNAYPVHILFPKAARIMDLNINPIEWGGLSRDIALSKKEVSSSDLNNIDGYAAGNQVIDLAIPSLSTNILTIESEHKLVNTADTYDVYELNVNGHIVVLRYGYGSLTLRMDDIALGGSTKSFSMFSKLLSRGFGDDVRCRLVISGLESYIKMSLLINDIEILHAVTDVSASNFAVDGAKIYCLKKFPLKSYNIYNAGVMPESTDSDSINTSSTDNKKARITYIDRGETSNKPRTDAIQVGYLYFNTTINKPTWWNGTNWIDATGTVV